MAIYILNVMAKRGHENEVTELFTARQEQLEQADGFQSVTVYRARDGLFVHTVRQVYTQEELDQMANQEQPGPDGIHFMIHETWESPEQRVRFSRANERQFLGQLVPHLLPEHSHEFYDVV